MKLIIPKPCHENWNAMTPVEKGRFCSVCRKTVKDFTKLSDDEIIQDLAINSNICVNATSDQLNRNLNYSFINSLFTKFAVGFILTSGGIIAVNAQESLIKKDTGSLIVRGEISSVSPIKKGKVKISEDFRIVAARTITRDNIPLYILDGEIISDNKMKKLDPNSIEKVEVLKGASATALYGSRAQNGAINITSKKYLKGRESKILGK
jgi:TonB-dependent SusC/RagA subfamily outer membrane receptor